MKTGPEIQKKNTDLKVKTPKEIKPFTDRKNMGRLFLFFLFSSFISFNVGADDKKDDTTTTFNENECIGNSDIDSLCKIKKSANINEKLAKAAGLKSRGVLLSSPYISEGEGGSCSEEKAITCCSDPTTCLGGKALSTFQDVSNIVSKVGPGMAMMLQGFGEDMSGLCEAMQGLAGSGAGLSLAAKGKCDGAISSCHSNCDKDTHEKQCPLYIKAKQACETAKSNCQNNIACNNFDTIYKDFKKAGEPPVKKINENKKKKKICTAQKVKSKELLENMGEMANSAISSELCKQQSKIARNKEECRAAGGTWTNFECKMPEEKEEKEETVSLREGEGSVPQQPTGSMGINTETPTSTSQNTVPNPDDPDNTRMGGGGKLNNSPGGEGPIPYPTAATDIDTESDSDGTGTTAGQSKSSGTSGLFSGFGGSGYDSPYRRANNEEEEDDDSLSMGGGGFAGYGGGGGFGDSDSQASLGLSKKKLEELKKKKGAQRVTASDAKGTHQNIFERITKRFQSLCQSKLDCR